MISKLRGGKNEKLRRGFLKWRTMSITGFPIQMLLPKSKEERIEVISRLLFTFVTHKLQEHLNFSNTFSHLFHNYDVTSLQNIIQSHFESMQSVVKKSACSFKSMFFFELLLKDTKNYDYSELFFWKCSEKVFHTTALTSSFSHGNNNHRIFFSSHRVSD